MAAILSSWAHGCALAAATEPAPAQVCRRWIPMDLSESPRPWSARSTAVRRRRHRGALSRRRAEKIFGAAPAIRRGRGPPRRWWKSSSSPPRLGTLITASAACTGGTGAGRGDDDGILMSLELMNRIIEIDPQSMTMTVEAGATLQSVSEAARGCRAADAARSRLARIGDDRAATSRPMPAACVCCAGA